MLEELNLAQDLLPWLTVAGIVSTAVVAGNGFTVHCTCPLLTAAPGGEGMARLDSKSMEHRTFWKDMPEGSSLHAIV